MRRLIPPVDCAATAMAGFVDADTDAFNDYMHAMKLPKATDEERAARETAMQAGLKKAIAVPQGLAAAANAVWPQVVELAKLGNINCKSDIQVTDNLSIMFKNCP